MPVSVLIISHNNVGDALIKAATTTFGELPLPTKTVAVDYRADPAELLPKLQRAVKNIEHGDGILILTDMFGSTPCNIAQALHNESQICIVTGLNLPMLIRVMNYPNLTLSKLAKRALSGGKKGILMMNKCHEPILC